MVKMDKLFLIDDIKFVIFFCRLKFVKCGGKVEIVKMVNVVEIKIVYVEVIWSDLKMVKFNVDYKMVIIVDLKMWSIEDMNTIDLSLTYHINYNGKYAKIIPHSEDRFQIQRFRKAQCPIVERFACPLMMHGRNDEKRIKANNVLKHNFELISLMTGRLNSRWRSKMATLINQMAEKSQIVSPTCSWAPDRGRDISDQATEQISDGTTEQMW